MKTATRPIPIEIECQFCDFKGNAAEGARHRQETQHLIRIVGERDAPIPQETPAQELSFGVPEAAHGQIKSHKFTLDLKGKGNGLPNVENAPERNLTQTAAIPEPFIFANCANGNCPDCLYQWPDATGVTDASRQPILRTCEHFCHSQPRPTPETVHISLPGLRAIVFNAIDAKTWKFYSYEWANDDTAENEAIEHCCEFVDLICERLRQLPAVTKREKR